MIDKRCIEKVMTLSTGHMPESEPDFGTLRAVPFEFGYIVWVNTYDLEDETDRMPEWLMNAWHLAKSEGCTLIMFDRDVEHIEGLPKWDW